MRHPALVSAALVAFLVWDCATPVRAAETYTVAGRDTITIGENDISSEVSYSGTQVLRIERRGRTLRYRAHVDYTRNDGTASSPATCEYVADVLPSGETLDTADGDPDYLTVLNQPFAARLDPSTLADLRRLRGAIPFEFPSPFTGASLHGFLRHESSGYVGRRRSIGVRFEAAGPMRGALPDRPGLTLKGTIAMRGTAYYDAHSALLLALRTTVTISGNVANRAGADRVRIVFVRGIRARQ